MPLVIVPKKETEMVFSRKFQVRTSESVLASDMAFTGAGCVLGAGQGGAWPTSVV